MHYRPATEGDVAAIRRVAEAAWDADYPGIVSRETATEVVEDWYGEQRLREAIADPLTPVLVAVDDAGTAADTGADDDAGTAADTGADNDGEGGEEVIAFSHAALGTENWVGTVLRLYVVPGARRRGVGSELLERTVDTLTAQGAERVRAFVLADNDPGNAFYRAARFDRVDTGETLIGGEAFDEHVYEYRPDGRRQWPPNKSESM